MPYTLKYHTAVKDDLKKIDAFSKSRIKKAIETILLKYPLNSGKFLKGNLKKFKKLRIGDYRIIYKIEKKEILILAVMHRKDIYEVLKKRQLDQ